MVYIFLDKNQIKSLFVKKNLFGQYEVGFFEKNFQIDLLENGLVKNTDILASAIKEVINNLFGSQTKEKEVALILPQEAFQFLRAETPENIAKDTVKDFVINKIAAHFSFNSNDYFIDFFHQLDGNSRQTNIFAIAKDKATRFAEVFNLVDLKVEKIIPEGLAYFKLFDKTLHKGRKENVLFGRYNESSFSLFLYDGNGLVDGKKISLETKTKTSLEKELKLKAGEFEKNKQKINRLILSGEKSTEIRQDTFTKNSGMWTNPLKKILDNFYQDQLKLLTTYAKKPFPVLNFDVCLGAFIFTNDIKDFSLIKKMGRVASYKPSQPKKESIFGSKPVKKPLIKKEYLIFVFSFLASLAFFTLISKSNLNLSLPSINFKLPQKATPTPTAKPLPSPTPTLAIKKEELKVKILNGSGTPGKANELKSLMQKLDYQDIVTGNADNYDYETSVIQVKKTNEAAFSLLRNDLKEYIANPQGETLDEKETADVVIIIGQDFK